MAGSGRTALGFSMAGVPAAACSRGRTALGGPDLLVRCGTTSASDCETATTHQRRREDFLSARGHWPIWLDIIQLAGRSITLAGCNE